MHVKIKFEIENSRYAYYQISLMQKKLLLQIISEIKNLTNYFLWSG